MTLTFSFTVDGSPTTSLDLGDIFQGSEKTKKITVINDGALEENVYFTVTDGNGLTTAKKTVLGGNEISENVADSYVFGSLDGRSWYQLAGLNKKLLLSNSFANGATIDIYIKVEVPAGSKLNTQSLAVCFLTES